MECQGYLEFSTKHNMRHQSSAGGMMTVDFPAIDLDGAKDTTHALPSGWRLAISCVGPSKTVKVGCCTHRVTAWLQPYDVEVVVNAADIGA